MSNLFGVAGRDIALGTGRGSGAACAFTRVGFQLQRSRCLKFLFGLTSDLSFLLFFTTSQVAGKGFSGNGVCEMGPQLGVYSTSPARETKIIYSAKGGFGSVGARTPDVFFSGQDEER